MLKILVPLDGSACAERAVRQVIAMAAEGVKADVHLLHVQADTPLNDVDEIARPGLVERLRLDDADAAFANATRLLAEAGVQYSTRTVTGDPAQEIALYADIYACDEIVMGTRGLGPVKDLLMGSVATKVVHMAKMPVMLVK
jgi:nucleotide-binding universal stress UspA family protein